MPLLDINGWEFILLIVLAVVILGPERLPDYAAKLARGVRKARQLAEGARGQLEEQLGDEYKQIDWRQYDPRQYDPRRIVREALMEPLDEAISPLRETVGDFKSSVDGSLTDAGLQRDRAGGATASSVMADAAGGGFAAAAARHAAEADYPTPEERGEYADTGWGAPGWGLAVHDPDRPTPYDLEAT